jgi:hypothetical protein
VVTHLDVARPLVTECEEAHSPKMAARVTKTMRMLCLQATFRDERCYEETINYSTPSVSGKSILKFDPAVPRGYTSESKGNLFLFCP